MKSDEVGTTLKHPETINGNVKNLSKRIKRKDKGTVNFKGNNLTLGSRECLGSVPRSVALPKGQGGSSKGLERAPRGSPWTLLLGQHFWAWDPGGGRSLQH
jgi:hypothetical protein